MGCIHAQRKEDLKSDKQWKDVGACAFCRTSCQQKDEDEIKNLKKCIERDNANAVHVLGTHYLYGKFGMRKDLTKAVELFLKAGEMGHAQAYWTLGMIYEDGMYGKRDHKKARHYYELAAIGGSLDARHSLGCMHGRAGDIVRACKHFLIGAKAGDERNMKQVKIQYLNGSVAKDDYDEAMRAFQNQQDAAKSVGRDDFLDWNANPDLYWLNFMKDNNLYFNQFGSE